MKYKKGDTVILARRDPVRGNYGIDDHYFNLEYTVMDVYDDGAQYCIAGNTQFFSAFEGMLEPVGGPW